MSSSSRLTSANWFVFATGEKIIQDFLRREAAFTIFRFHLRKRFGATRRRAKGDRESKEKSIAATWVAHNLRCAA